MARPIATGVASSVVRMSAWLSAGKKASTAKAAEPIEISIEGAGTVVKRGSTSMPPGEYD